MTVQNYTYIAMCPSTHQLLSDNDVYYTNGVCPRCGNVATGTITHYKKIVGWWEQPSLFRRLLGARPKFHRKPDPEV